MSKSFLFDSSREISSGLGLVAVVVLSVVVGWYAVKAGGQIVKYSETVLVTNIDTENVR